MLNIRTCRTPADFSHAGDLTRAYIEWLGMDLSFQDIGGELAGFATQYASPQGLFLLAFQDQCFAGGVGLRNFEAGICEMKRLYVYDDFRKQGIGQRLCADVIAAARQQDYTHMRLDTLNRLGAAVSLYQSFGFYDINAYRYNPDPGARYMELKL